MSKKKIPQEAIEAAAKWWMNRISGQTIHDNGDDHFGSMLAGALADMHAEMLDSDRAHKFKDVLVEKLTKLVSDNRPSIWLDCDYSPCVTLLEAARQTGVPLDNFPWKTTMKIHPDNVQVKNGYGQPYVAIWHS